MSWRGARQPVWVDPFPPVDETQQHATLLPLTSGPVPTFGAAPAPQTAPGTIMGGSLLGSDGLGTVPRPVPGAFIRDAGLTAGTLTLRAGYLPPTLGDRLGVRPTEADLVGGFAIGRSAVGVRRGLHGRIEEGNPPGHGETETRG